MKWSDYQVWMRWHRPAGVALLGFPGMWSLIEASAPWRLHVLWWVGVFLARTWGCMINDWVDRDLDAQVQRTQHRPWAKGSMPPVLSALLFGLISILGLFCLSCFDAISVMRALMLLLGAAVYPWSKRWTCCPQVLLALLFSGSLFVSQTLMKDSQVFPWFAINFFWVLGYDSLYALQDAKEDQKAKVGSLPVYLGSWIGPFVGLCYAVFSVLLWSKLSGLGWGVLQIFLLVQSKIHEPDQVLKWNVVIGMVISLGLWAHVSCEI